jgi:phosphotransferase system  glucose/maltose/N-acetylglucosamine-specific IIC component
MNLLKLINLNMHLFAYNIINFILYINLDNNENIYISMVMLLISYYIYLYKLMQYFHINNDMYI